MNFCVTHLYVHMYVYVCTYVQAQKHCHSKEKHAAVLIETYYKKYKEVTLYICIYQGFATKQNLFQDFKI